MEFVAKYHGEKIRIVNPNGCAGIVTLWSLVEATYRVFEGAGIDLSPQTSHIAVMANLFGNGLPHMLRNLLYNPQITHIVICGKNLSGSREWLLNYFEHGLEEVSFLGAKSYQIVGTDRKIDGEVLPEHFARKPIFVVYGDISSNETQQGIKSFLETISASSSDSFPRVEPPSIPEPVVTRFPSNPGAHLIVRRTSDEAWRELVFRLFRFGHRNTVAKSSGTEIRIELQNVQVVVEDPREESSEVLARSGFDLEKFRSYQERILDPALPSDLSYTYGWLLRTGMEEISVDSLSIIVDRLKKDPESRHCYATLWNNSRHLPGGKSCPCFATVFFRKFEERLTMTATFRAHNAMDAWPENFYGLMAIQSYVSDRVGIPVGPITVISHSISLDPTSLDKAKKIVDSKTTDEVFDSVTEKFGPRFDPNGVFTVTFDKEAGELIVEHSFEGMKIGEYRGKSAEEIELQLSRDGALSVISHALYLGRELARAQIKMKASLSK